eukprot:g16002.t1
MFDAEMNKILSDPSDDTKGFFDPNTKDNLTYMQLMERCVMEPETGLCLLCLRDLKKISLMELLKSEIIDRQTFEEAQTGNLTVTDLLKKSSVQKYLEGDSSIAGILVESTNEKMSIHQAMKKGLLMPGTALILL